MIVIVDYGMGNLRSVSKALEHLGAKVKVSSLPKDIEKAKKLVLPGVGAFGDAVRELHSAKLFDPVKAYLRSERPFLGICLGLQLLFRSSEESPEVTGFDFFPSTVKLFRSPGIKVPHMGWNQVKIEADHPMFRGVPDQSYFYFVHSYYASGGGKEVLGRTYHGDEAFGAVIGSGKIFATQFHPEKSQQAGLTLLKNFVGWS